VDRTTLGEQASDRLKDVRLENLQPFPDIYGVKELGDLRPEADTRLHIATIQGMIKRILYPSDEAQPVPVDWYDCVIIDECHRGYNLDQEMSDAALQFRSESDYISTYRRVLDHFDAVRIGLTATPALHTTEIFGLSVFEYSYRQAVIDGWLVDHEPPYRLVPGSPKKA
jgi:type I restriction enzyme R subunit